VSKYCLKFGHDSFFPRHFQFMGHLSP
jgi:hypothetical protein